jgi:hypothetical protein
MNVWTQIDQLKRQHDEDFRRVEVALEGFRAIKGSLVFDEFGWWSCRYIPKGERSQQRAQARTGGGARRETEGGPRRGSPEGARVS